MKNIFVYLLMCGWLVYSVESIYSEHLNVKNIESTVSSLLADVKCAKEAIVNHENKILAYDTSFKEMSFKMVDVYETLVNFYNRYGLNTSFNLDTTTLEHSIDDLRTEIEKERRRINTLESRINNNVERLNGLQNRLNSQENDVREQGSTIRNIQTEIDNLKRNG